MLIKCNFMKAVLMDMTKNNRMKNAVLGRDYSK